MSSPLILNKRQKTTASSYFHLTFEREKVNEIRYFKRRSK